MGMPDPLANEDDHHPDDWGGFQLRDLHRHLRRSADQHVRDVEALLLLRSRGYPHGKVRELLGLSPERYRDVNRAAREAVAAVTLAASDS